MAVVERIRDAAHAAGLIDGDLLVDCLVLTAATDPAAAETTLAAVREVHGRGLATVLGVSNVSHGLPARPALNAAFLAMAVGAGLDAAIIDPADPAVRRARVASDVLLGRDPRCERWIALSSAEAADAARRQASPDGGAAVASRGEVPEPAPAPLDAAGALADAVERGDVDGAPRFVDEMVADGADPRDIIAAVLTPAIQRLGDAFGRGEVFLPQLMVAAEAMKAAVTEVQDLPPGGRGALRRPRGVRDREGRHALDREGHLRLHAASRRGSR